MPHVHDALLVLSLGAVIAIATVVLAVLARFGRME
jgi:hypothetical protein